MQIQARLHSKAIAQESAGTTEKPFAAREPLCPKEGFASAVLMAQSPLQRCLDELPKPLCMSLHDGTRTDVYPASRLPASNPPCE